MTVTIDRAPSLDILEGLAQELDPSEERIRLGRGRYEDLGGWMKQYAGRTAQRDVEVYPQGSFNLGTTNQDPLSYEFDIDLVIRLDYAKTEISQRELNQQVNGWLASYVSVRQAEGDILAPTGLEKGKRAWTLQYDDAFHMDVLPVVPAYGDELPARSGDPSWLTDKALVNWQPTNPKGFANWFRGLAAIEWRIVAKRADIQVDPLPEHGARTALQMAVKIIKRHRDHYFADDPANLAPPSALVSVLAALAYERHAGEGSSLKIVLPAVVEDLPNYLGRRDGQLWIANPTCPDENYADRYAGNWQKEDALRKWLDRVRADLGVIAQPDGLHKVAKSIDEVFGASLGSRVVRRIGSVADQARTAGSLGTSASGLLIPQASRPHRPHTNYGCSPA
jgi:hypothetical protein